VARGDTTRREIEPLGLVRLQDYWMVPAYCRLRRDLRVFRVDRVREARLTGETFQPGPAWAWRTSSGRRSKSRSRPSSGRSESGHTFLTHVVSPPLHLLPGGRHDPPRRTR